MYQSVYFEGHMLTDELSQDINQRPWPHPRYYYDALGCIAFKRYIICVIETSKMAANDIEIYVNVTDKWPFTPSPIQICAVVFQGNKFWKISWIIE